MSFGPKELKFNEILINSIWSLIAWAIWSIMIIIITFAISSIVNIPTEFSNASKWIAINSWGANAFFPLILSIITLIWTTTTIFLTYFIINLTDGERYKRNIIILWQITFFAIITYLFLTPCYIYAWLININYILYVFLFHSIIVVFWTSILLEILNNYRYILIWIYWSFIWLFVSIIITILIFSSIDSWLWKLISLVIILPLINFMVTFFKQVFEYFYFIYFRYTNQDKLWDIFYQIELEEKELLQQEEEKNSI